MMSHVFDSGCEHQIGHKADDDGLVFIGYHAVIVTNLGIEDKLKMVSEGK
jgi:hypothetical protein